jgi:hypothetical protein
MDLFGATASTSCRRLRAGDRHPRRSCIRGGTAATPRCPSSCRCTPLTAPCRRTMWWFAGGHDAQAVTADHPDNVVVDPGIDGLGLPRRQRAVGVREREPGLPCREPRGRRPRPPLNRSPRRCRARRSAGCPRAGHWRRRGSALRRRARLRRTSWRGCRRRRRARSRPALRSGATGSRCPGWRRRVVAVPDPVAIAVDPVPVPGVAGNCRGPPAPAELSPERTPRRVLRPKSLSTE